MNGTEHLPNNFSAKQRKNSARKDAAVGDILGLSIFNGDDTSSIGAKIPSSQAHLYALALDVVVVPPVLGRGIAHPLPA